MKILFVYKGRYHIRDSITIEYLSAIAKKYAHQTDLVYDQDIFGVTDNVISVPFLNRIFSKDNRIIKNIVNKEPEIIVFLDGFNRTIWNRELSKRLKRINKGLITVLFSPWHLTSATDIYDYICIGEPESSMEKFLTEKIFNAHKGTYESRELVDLNNLPLPDKKLFEPYIHFKDSYMIYTSKGCPCQCSYCEETLYKQRWGNGYFRRKRPEGVILELEEAKKNFDIREVIYKDAVFALDKEWLKTYLRAYGKQIDLPYKCFGKAEVFDEELAFMLKESRCYCVEFGVQTFNEQIKQDILKRNERTDTLLKAFSICEKYNLRYDADHMFGVPGEQLKDHIEAAKIYLALKYINRIKCHNLVYYRQAQIYDYAPPAVRDNKDYVADFFSFVAGDKDMLKTNSIFERYFKILPLLPRKLNLLILKGKNWKVFHYIPNFLLVFLMLLLAIKKHDKRFKIYCKYYPRKLMLALRGW